MVCGTFIFSRTGHDYRSCKCGASSIDGGFDYTKTSGSKHTYITFSLPIGVTKKMLYDDWNKSKDKYGYYEVGSWPVFAQRAILENDDMKRLVVEVEKAKKEKANG